MELTAKRRHWSIRMIRKFLFGILLILVLLNLFILLSGRTYLYKGIANTYMKGLKGPTIYDKDLFESATIQNSKTPVSWEKTISGNMVALLDEETKYLQHLKSNSFLVFKGDTLISETYFGKHKRNTVSNSFSVAKTFVAMLVGCALDEGKIKSLDESVGNYLPEFKTGAKKKVTIRHLLMMASGLDWSESGANPLSDNAESYYGTGLRKLVCNQELISEPGVKYSYQSGNSQLLGFIIESATKMDLSEYASLKLWSKFGAENEAFWSLDEAGGSEKAFCCVYGTSRDYGRIGRVIAQEGKWKNEQLISSSFMKEMCANPKMLCDDVLPNHRYGLHIWTYLGDKNPVYYCRGVAGQFIIVLPKEDIVIVRTGMDREKSLVLKEGQRKNKKYINDNEYQFGHATDLYKYIAIAKRMVATSK
jgi:CubicO group peptidase (beta-lactamase class C family)